MIKLRTLAVVPVLALAAVACGDDAPARAATATKGDAFCTAAEKVDVLADSLGDSLFSGDPKVAETGMSALLAAAQGAQKIAPTDIKAVVDKNIDGYQQLQAGLKKFNWDADAAGADPDILALLTSEELTTNNETLSNYLADKCGIDAS